MTRKNRILVGFMGSGKTTIGRFLAEAAGFTFVDTDARIEAEEGRSIPEIFSACGEAYFRAVEKRVLAEEAALDGRILATGGGAVIDSDNIRLLRESGDVFYLRWTPESIYDHLLIDQVRPPLDAYTGEALREQIRRLLAEREDHYLRAAHHVIDCEGRTMEQIAADLKEEFF